MPTFRIISFFGGSDFSTSALSRRSRNGRSTLCSCCTTSTLSSPSAPVPNHSSNCPALPNTSGSRKLSKAQSSCRLFCNGVPVMSKRLLHANMRIVLDRREFSFLMRCASSMMMYRQWNFFSAFFSLMTISYDVTQTSNFPGCRCSAICALRISALPWNLNARIIGHHRLNSFIQFPSVDFGTTTMCGPVIPRYSERYPSMEMVCSVLPRPISSAKMPLMPWSNRRIIQFKPASWYSRIFPNLMHSGCTVSRTAWYSSACSTISASSSSSACFPRRPGFFAFSAFVPARK
mmetsp:Transcript_598/g.2314  ORF Transcript_598/g.2314 Transcript_598/m.2314 type:complete len:290 (+) Transcript_598:1952-2821(+)